MPDIRAVRPAPTAVCRTPVGYFQALEDVCQRINPAKRADHRICFECVWNNLSTFEWKFICVVNNMSKIQLLIQTQEINTWIFQPFSMIFFSRLMTLSDISPRQGPDQILRERSQVSCLHQSSPTITLYRDGGRHRLPNVYDPILTSHSLLVTTDVRKSH